MRSARYSGGSDERPRPLVSPANMMPVEVVRREEVAPDVVTLYLVIPGTQQPPAPYLPGQFVTLALPTANETLYRSYSLCGAGLPDRPWEITIKRLREGAVSTYLFDVVDAGTLLYASFPRGAFTLPARVGPDTPLIFVAAGSGITPIIGMLRAIAQLPARRRPHVQLHYASRSPRDVIFSEELARMDHDGNWLHQWHYLSGRGHRITPEEVIFHAGRHLKKAHWYMCGPEDLKADLQELLEYHGVPQDRILSEVFATQRGASRIDFKIVEANDLTNASFMRIQTTDAVLGVQANETVLAALERHGYRPEFSCRAGSCGVCKLKLASGSVAPLSGPGLHPRDRANGFILSCIAYPQGDIVLESGGRPPAANGAAEAASTGANRMVAMTALRLGTIAATAGVVAGAWQLTNHRPSSWQAQAQTQPVVTTTPQPTATHVPKGGKPTPTPIVTAGGPTPTTVVGSPTPTAAPPPPPTATPVKTGATPTPVH